MYKRQEKSCSFNLLTDEVPFLNRHQHVSVFFDDKIWVVGGEQKVLGEFPELKNDVWYSENGKDWTLATNNAEFEPRRNFSMVVFDNKMWVFGGNGYIDGSTSPFKSLSDIWNSEDGITWNKVETNADLGLLSLQNTVVHNNRIFILKEGSGTTLSSNWYSNDGINWTEIEIKNDFPLRQGITATSFNGRIWMIAGVGLPSGALGGFSTKWNNVWSSSDGITWIEETSSAEFSKRHSHAASVFDNKIWITGGNDDQGASTEVWSSSDGKTWVLECSEAFDKRLDHTIISSNDNIFIIGGSKPGPTYSDVLSIK